VSEQRNESSAARVRVKESVNSTLRGQVLMVLRKERQKTGRYSYLCEMPGWPQPGWFREEEVERVEG
jgi:hypothetical protein